MKFICDHMLGSLARWMRMLGFDTAYSLPIDDEELLKIAMREDRILLTRDKNIRQREKLKILRIESDDLDEQLKELLKAYDLPIESPMSRCSLCNTPIEEVRREDCIGKVPQGAYERQDKFWFCRKCDKYYWAGSHWNKIMDRIEELKSI